ncbi:ABC transporter ATP-binding protein [Chamaesiphon sp. VAR_48_metabat_135_sub]|uniref:ABC transporter ATP-binding protein n=1 Tax=Chamaesiphon sp. VAR_48_metabat_135_sub TaxID=2964699 RepID=UPI00286A426F|nr:ABC transporter ATP-binding protein [Chamaesiphon sp. VAR_48_metabat_135_sub]
MSDTVIRVENLGKKYVLGHQRQERYATLRDTISNSSKNLVDKLKGKSSADSTYEEFWALKDVSFEIKQGDRVGIIGRNGAGKSTLLKILSRITEPTKGSIRIKGRVASLLEVGTGFHPELTGRENIFLNGAILGMGKVEIQRKFDEIVAFAEVEKFLDTPVKRYSSGMYVRLAFAVAAHLEPEILIVDEVLAVGDAQFQQKCLGKMEQIGNEGRTVVFVSHNMATIKHLCSTGILLKAGQVHKVGKPLDIISHYLSDAHVSSTVDLTDWQDRETTKAAKITSFVITDGEGNETTNFSIGDDLCFRLHTKFNEPIFNPSFGVIIHDSFGEYILDIRSTHSNFEVGRIDNLLTVQVRLDNLGLCPGRYLLSPWINDAAAKVNIDYVKLCATIEIEAESRFHDVSPLVGKYWVPSEWTEVKAKLKVES